jgi:hypothetical protein
MTSVVAEITKDDEGTWLHDCSGKKVSLSNSPGQHIHEFVMNNVLKANFPFQEDHPVKQAGKAVTHATKRAVAYMTGACALLIVSVSAVAALFYAATHSSETLQNLASSTLTGVGMAIGGCLGSALILRFKSARHYIRSVLKDLQ